MNYLRTIEVSNHNIANIMRTILRSAGTKIFGVTFRKKDGSIRNMNCRFGVTKHLTRSTNNYRTPRKLVDERCGQVTVYDINKKGYRKINLDQILTVSINGNFLSVN